MENADNERVSQCSKCSACKNGTLWNACIAARSVIFFYINYIIWQHRFTFAQMVRRITGYFLIAALLSANFSTLFVFAGFKLNRDYIAAHLCVNRSKPWLHCNGKCYFIRKLKQVQEKERNEDRQAQKNLFQDALISQRTETKFYTGLLQKIAMSKQHIILPLVDTPVFQPPKTG